MRSPITPKAIRRLVAAEGYLDLDLPQYAVEELEKATDVGPLEAPRKLLLGLAWKRNGDPETAIPHLEQAARTLPKPVRRFAWSELADCYRFVGSDDLADLAERLGGDREFELRIALATDVITVRSTDVTSDVSGT